MSEPAGSPRTFGAVWRSAYLTALAVLPVFLVGALAPVLRAEQGISAAEIGAMSGVFFATSAVTASAAGALTERFGTRTVLVLTASTTLIAMSMFAAGLPVGWMYLAAAASGLGQAFVQPATNTMLASAVPTRRLGVAIASKQAAIPLATLLSGALVALVATRASWQTVFLGGVALAVIMLVAASTGPAVRLQRGGGAEASSLPARLRTARVLTAIAAAAASAAGTAIMLFLTDALVEKGHSVGGAGAILALAAVLGAMLRIGLGLRADRHPRGDHFGVIGALLLLAVPCVVLTATGSAALAAVGAVLAYVLGFSWNGLLMYALVVLSPSTPGRATSLAQMALGGGATVGPLLFGVLRDAQLPFVAWGAVCALLAIGGVCMLWGGRSARSAERS